MSESGKPNKLRNALFMAGGAGLGVVVANIGARSMGLDPGALYAGPIGAGAGAALGALLGYLTRKSND